MTENAAASTTAATTVVPTVFTKVDLEDRKKKNDAWIHAFKKTQGVKKQTTLPSQTMQHNEWAIRSGWSMSDATTWRGVCEKAKYAFDDIEGLGIISLVGETIDMASHCNTHPIALIHFARTVHGRPVWDLDTIDYLKENMLSDDEKDSNDIVDIDAPEGVVWGSDDEADTGNMGGDQPTQPMSPPTSPPAFPTEKRERKKRRLFEKRKPVSAEDAAKNAANS